MGRIQAALYGLDTVLLFEDYDHILREYKPLPDVEIAKYWFIRSTLTQIRKERQKKRAACEAILVKQNLVAQTVVRALLLSFL